ncbi:hypothetical protein DJ66_0231 [Candidatus Liberibacter solanacearum]|uniref:Uncharacterized protein n=1 Tax=Candidatus Liberibacter solanacearum TaxID=556287 RepID=A0A0F4VPN3_9HYPH|nr:hypothetical protein [Candidatus Liberibacter solanacearum]KJZ82622.1 hypothetical protein DJ66_0231 [Candidatus Liberibacter solanacearum]
MLNFNEFHKTSLLHSDIWIPGTITLFHFFAPSFQLIQQHISFRHLILTNQIPFVGKLGSSFHGKPGSSFS